MDVVSALLHIPVPIDVTATFSYHPQLLLKYIYNIYINIHKTSIGPGVYETNTYTYIYVYTYIDESHVACNKYTGFQILSMYTFNPFVSFIYIHKMERTRLYSYNILSEKGGIIKSWHV